DHLRDVGGFDRHFGLSEQLSRHDQAEVDALERLSRRAARCLSTERLLEDLEEEAERLRTARNGEGIELVTVHGAKGREWDTVVVAGMDDDLFPHQRGILEAKSDDDLQRVIESE